MSCASRHKAVPTSFSTKSPLLNRTYFHTTEDKCLFLTSSCHFLLTYFCLISHKHATKSMSETNSKQDNDYDQHGELMQK